MTEPVFFIDGNALRAWLDIHAASQTQLLVGYYKVSSGRPSVSWSDSVDEALCYGWIDGRRQRISELAYAIRFTPRQPSSIWSAINIEKFERLHAQGRTTPAGVQAYARRTAHKSGVYYHEQTTPVELSPADLELFSQHPVAWAYFASTPPGYQKRMAHWVCSAKQTATRATRLLKLIQTSGAQCRLP